MSRLPLREAIRRQVEQTRLDDDQFAALERLARPPSAPSVTPPTPGGLGRRRWLAIAAALVLGAAGAWFGLDATPLTQRIAREVAGNHTKLKPLEVQSTTVDGLRGFFDKLDFALVDSPTWRGEGWSLLGGRHCSVQGLAAAQFRLSHPGRTGVRSVYMAPYDQTVLGVLPRVDQGESPIVVHARGITVRVWVERDVVIAATDPPPR